MIRFIRLIGVVLPAMFALASPAIAQTVVVSGRVIDGSTSSAIGGASVTLGGALTVLTDGNGEFSFRNVRAGAHSLTVAAPGYMTASQRIEVRSVTTLTIALTVEPFRADTLRVNTRFVKVRGYLKEHETGRAVMGATIYTSGKPNANTKRAGFFEFDRVPAGVPLDLYVFAFGLEQLNLSVIPERDTTLHITLRNDTMTERLIAEPSRRLEQRAVATPGRSYTIDREELLSQPEGDLAQTIGIVLRTVPYATRRPTECWFIDERRSGPEALITTYPEEVERVEVLFAGAMIRVYTRRYIAEMITSKVDLERPGYAQAPPGFLGRSAVLPPSCR